MKIKDRKIVYNGFFKVQQITLEHHHKTLQRELIVPKNAVAALVYDTKKELYILTEQYRVAADRNIIEIVAGLLDKEDEKPEETIAREIEEEVGYAVDKLEFINCFYSTPGSYAEKIWLYYAEVSEQISEGGGLDSEDENLTTVSFSREKLFSTKFEDAKTLIAVLCEQCKGHS